MKQGRLLFALTWVLIFSTLLSLTGLAANVTTVENISQSSTAALNYLKEQFGTTGDTYTVPGLVQTVTRDNSGENVVTCDNMVPQGLAFCGPSGKYLLISAYCNCGEKHRSVIYVIDSSTKEYQVTLITDTTCHMGGLAYDGNYIWVCDSESEPAIRAFRYSALESAISHTYWTVYTQASRTVDTTPSYMCYANDLLYVGTFSETNSSMKIYFYETNEKTVTKKGSFTVNGVTKIQGISIRNGCMILTSSYGRTNKSDAYIFTDPGSRFMRDGAVYNASNAKHISLPNMAEGCYIGSTYTYFLFESGAKTYRSSANTMPLDQYVRFKHDVVGVKLNDTPVPVQAQVSGGVYSIQNVGDPSRSIHIRSGSAEEGAGAELQSTVQQNSQRFAIQKGKDGYYTLRNVNSGKLLQVANGGANGEYKVTQGADAGEKWQKWVIMDNQDGTFSMINAATDKYLDLDNNTVDDGRDIQTWNSNGTDAQKWTLQAQTVLGLEGNYYICAQSAQGLVMAGNGVDTNVYLEEKSMSNHQKFALKANSGGYFTLTALGSGRNLRMESQSTSNGVNVGLGSTTSGGADASERWQLVPKGDGSYCLVSLYNTLCADAKGGILESGTNIQGWEWNETTAQRWILKTAPLEVNHTYTAVDNGDGTHTKTCSQCFATETEAHVLETTSVFPTETEKGYELHTCTLCGYQEKTNEISLEEVTESLEFAQASVYLASDISIRFYVRQENLAGWTSPVVTFTKERYDREGNVTETVRQQVSDYTLSGDYRVYTCTGINSTEMGSKITAVISANHGAIRCTGKAITYSVTDYVAHMFAGEISDELKTLLVDLLNYGAEAQTYFGYNLAHPANEILTEEQAAWGTKNQPALTSVKHLEKQEGATVHFQTCSLSLRERVEINYYLDLSQYTGSVENLYARITRNGTSVRVGGKDFRSKTEESGTTYVVSYDGLNALQMRVPCTVEIFDAATGERVSDCLTYSIESYAAGASAALSSLTNAMMAYGDSAVAYFAAP